MLRYGRRPGQIEVQIRTDWQTTESVRLTHAGSDDPSLSRRCAQSTGQG